ncbi:midasin nuclear AAA ATPase [Crucibulum laeve]|uniref:Midasin n=1 Tax=Crucibulum laeve TaxID=68775 RepID=A0A5C3MHU8_9AGAR|nr:midasin nuclear AAA ATPase [Crucibulum laeve]
MTTTSAIHDPLYINLRRQTQLLISMLPANSQYVAELTQSSTTRELLTTLSVLLAIPALTQKVATLFRPILLDLCARWLEVEGHTEEQLVALCYLLEVHEELYPVLSKLIEKFPGGGPLYFITTAPSPLSFHTPRLQRLLLAYYRILQANRELPHQILWPLAPLSNLMWTQHLDNAVRLLAVRCYALQSGMGEGEREKVEREILGEPCGVDCLLEYGHDTNGSILMVDGWIMPVIEVKRVNEEREAIVTTQHEYYDREEGDPAEFIRPSDLCPLTVNVHGVLLLRSTKGKESVSQLIPTPSAIDTLRSIALHISLHLPTLLTSPPSSGKSLFISHLAGVLYPGVNNHVITIHLADTSLDPRALLGSYISSPIQPGTFEWKEGVLVRAMREGKWVVFEDVDRGSNEVLGVIKPLVESLRLGKWIGGRAYLDVPSRGRVIAHNNFMLFATRSISASRAGTFPPPIFFGAHKYHEIVIHSPSTEELQTIVNAQFLRLAGCPAQALIHLWHSVKRLGSAASARDVGMRELEKYCQRVDRLLPASFQPISTAPNDREAPSFNILFPNPTLREDMYLEARDVFFGAGSTTASARSHSDTIASTIGEHLGLEADRMDWLLRGRTPEFDIEKNVNGVATAVRIGRTRLSAYMSNVKMTSPASRPFAMHRPAVLLLSRIATSVSLAEPVLLTGETGTGKTSVVTHLASLLHRPLISLNLSHQTESSDLIGGLKPVDARVPGADLQTRFIDLFGKAFSRKKNESFEVAIRKGINEGNWSRVVKLWKNGIEVARKHIRARQSEETSMDSVRIPSPDGPRKRRKVEGSESGPSDAQWSAFLQDVEEFEVQHVQGKGKFAFSFVEGPLIKALRSGNWVLLDEVNLASPEALECISGLLHGPTASITLTEHGSLEPVPRHPDFRLFACMNPATDVGKKDLPPNIRSRFTEIDVPPPDADKETLLSIVNQYIGHHAIGDKGVIMNVAEFYSAVKDLVEKRQIADGSNHRPHFSMRTLARALTFAADTASTYSLRRSIWEGCLMAFTMVLDSPSAEVVTALAHKHLLAGVRNPRSMLTKEPSVPRSRPPDEFIKFGPFYLEKGPLPEDPVEDYIMTPSVEGKLVDLARIILTRRFPVLIEGPTSSGKTSSVEYLAKRTGHRFVRINNHEHTDIQEYIGSYVSDPLTGKLIFKDGLLVRALRDGDWIVLDELNLAPSDVLEALNRLLDDNRELVIPETQEVVRPHPHFLLFATQNPPGLYAGRKVLSRAFRNRFLEVHFEDVPQAELETILCQRCRIAPSYGKRIVTVFHELQKRRQSSRVFESKHGFATLRDLFRWAGRDAISYQELAENGYMLLAERARREDDKTAVKEVIESVMGVKVDEDAMYSLQRPPIEVASFLGYPIPASSNIVWTKAMQRLYVLVCRALKFNEPVLLVGETGSGKTSVCQVFADASSQHLHGLNCHQNTETADLIGGLRPVRNRTATEAEVFREANEILAQAGVTGIASTFESLSSSLTNAAKLETNLSEYLRSRLQEVHKKLLRLQSIFEWHDGPLVQAMRNGDVFLLDEISLADDSVLERLNSVLEPGRTIVLAERGGADSGHPVIRAADDFKLVATMNPGGDYGKKELSPALRNRFTEVWVPRVEDRGDLELVVSSLWKHDTLKPFTNHVLDFVEWLCTRVNDRSLMSLRDILAWVVFSNSAYRSAYLSKMGIDEIFHHAAHMTYLDGLSSLPQLSAYSQDALGRLKKEAQEKLAEIVPLTPRNVQEDSMPVYDPTISLQLGSFAIPKGAKDPVHQAFSMIAPTTRDNAMRVVRACQVAKPILLEGSPGVGKTSLITALANLCGHELCRINLSDQTDLIDLFGSDLPVEGGSPGEFVWKDAEFLKALQDGHWVLLDEMNLAPQAVLEGLNAVLDHRGTVYIPELGKSFKCHPSFRIFAAQNPLNQGGGRKGLPKSFVNRFTKVYIEELTPDDLFMICQHLFPDLDDNVLRAMISFNVQLNNEVGKRRLFAREGSPWEFNLRDVIRWGTLLNTPGQSRHPAAYLSSIYLHRFRTIQDRSRARLMFDSIFSATTDQLENRPEWSITSEFLQVGHFIAKRDNMAPISRPGRILKMHLSALESLGDCVSQSWLAIITGHRDTGKTDVVRLLANFTGSILREVPVNSATDTMDILGSFEQVDIHGRVLSVIQEVLTFLDCHLRTLSGSQSSQSLQNRANSLRIADKNAPPQDLLRTASILLSDVHVEPEFHSEQFALQAKLSTLLSTSDSTGRFEWVDGPLIQAMKAGHWMLMDGANLCNPSVLDRLNSLCEPNGFMTLSERGFVEGHVQIIRPHKNFRLFMSMDPQFGELSRAMRNRGIEIALLGCPTADDSIIINNHLRIPLSLNMVGDHRASAIEFEAARRGIAQQKFVSELPLSTSGRVLDQSSALSSLLDQVPMLVTSTLPPNFDGLVFFLFRTLSPAYLAYFNRYLDALSGNGTSAFDAVKILLHTFPRQSLEDSLVQFRNSFAALKGLSSAFILAQPMDFYLNTSTCQQDMLAESELPSPHLTVIQLLDLGAILFLDDQDSRKARVSNIQVDSSTKRASNAVDLVLQAAKAAALEILNSFSENTMDLPSVKDIKLATSFISFGQYLRKASNTASFDFSAVQAVLRWMMDSLDCTSPRFVHLATEVEALYEVVSLSSGLGLMEIWSTLYADNASKLVGTKIQTLETLACNLKEDLAAANLRRKAFDVLSLITLPASLISHHATDASDIVIVLENNLRANSSHTSTTECSIDALSLIAELGAIVLIRGSAKDMSKMFENVIGLACHDGRSPLVRFVWYRHLLWALDAKQAPYPIITQIQMQWLEDLWNSCPLDPSIDGPSMLLHPTRLSATFTLCGMRKVPLQLLASYEADVSRHARMTLLQCNQNMTREQQLTVFLNQSICTLAACFGASFDNSILNAILTSSGDLVEFITRVIPLLTQSRNSAFCTAVRSFLLPCTERHKHFRESSLAHLGMCWVAVSRIIFDLVVPDAPVDPAAIGNCTLNRWHQQSAILEVQIQLHRQLEILSTGNNDNELLRSLERDLANNILQISKAPAVPIRTDVSRLHMFWSEVWQFQNNVIPVSRIDELIRLLEASGTSAALREKVIQESLSGFYQRLCTVYADFVDIAAPLKFAILHLRMGLRLIAQSATIRDPHTDSVAQLSIGLVTFPAIASSPVINSHSGAAGAAGITAFPYLLLQLSSLAMEKSIGVSMEKNDVILDAVYEQAIRLWLIDRAKEKELDEASQSLYRRTKLDHDDVGEAELEEQEFREMFPSFEDALEAELKPQSQTKTSSFELVDASKLSAFLDLHYQVVEPPSDAANWTAQLERLNVSRKGIMEQILEGRLGSLPDVLDDESLPSQLHLLRQKMTSLQGKSNQVIISSNFYVDANITEVKKAAMIVGDLRKRLEVLVTEWSDQMVLHHLIERCDGILGLDLHSPIAKVLSALEQLLVQTEDWEMYSNRENTLKSHQQALIVLIVEWRRLELSCWQSLLESQASSFSEGVAEWWFRLYDAIVRGPLSAAEQDDVGIDSALTQYLTDLVPLLDDFITSSPLGQFHARMRLLSSFEVYIHRIRQHKVEHERAALERTCRILNATIRYYGLFTPQLSNYLSEKRALLEKEIRAFIKLASWKDVNVQALKQSAQRTHHQLYKIIRKFRDVMRQRITEHLHPQMGGDVNAKSPSLESILSDIVIPSLPPGAMVIQYDSADASDHLINLNRTFNRYSSLISARIRPYIRSQSAENVDSFAVDIITTSKELAAISIPASVTPEKRLKQQKALLVRKRKAWSDLLKELKRAGFATSIKPEVLRHHTDSRWIREQPSLDGPAEESIVKGENYFTRLYAALPELRASISNHHSDLTTRELQRGMMFLESGFSMSIDLRSRLAKALHSLRKLQSISRRLQMVTPSTKIIVVGGNLLEHWVHVVDIHCKLSTALYEVLRGLNTIVELDSEGTNFATVIANITTWMDINDKLLNDLKTAQKWIQATPSPFLLENEDTLLTNSLSHASLASTMLVAYSEEYPQLKHLLLPVKNWFASQDTPFLQVTTPPSSERDNVDTLINSFLITVQTMVSSCQQDPETEDIDDDNYVLKGYRHVREFTHLLNIDAISSALEDLFIRLHTPAQLHNAFQCISPFLEIYIGLAKDQIDVHTHWTKTMLKLDFVLCDVMQTLCKQGFCQPPDSEEAGEGGETGETVSGTGLGEGTGSENASKEIEEESQVEGLQGEEVEKQDRQDKNDDDDAIEMNEDFDGNLEDIPDDGSQDEAGSDAESEVDPEEKLGKLDASDPAAVDEKLWGDEQGPEDSGDGDDKADQDHSEDKGGNSEMVAKEGKQPKEKQKKKEQRGDQKDGEDEAVPADEDEPVPEEGEESNDPNASGAPIDDYVKDADTLDLPDDIDLGQDDMDVGEEGMKNGEDEEMEDNDMVEDIPEDSRREETAEDIKLDEQYQQERALGDSPAPTDVDQEMEGEGGQVPEGEEEGEKDVEPENEQAPDEAVARPDVSGGEGTTEADDLMDPEGGKNEATGQAGSSMGAAGRASATQEQTMDKDGPSDSIQPETKQTADSQVGGSATSGAQEGQMPSAPEQQSSTNPLRSLGDALKEVRQRFDEVLNAEPTDVPRENLGEAGAQSQVEYLQPDDADHDMQALGPAGEEQVAKLDQLKLIDDDILGDTTTAMDIDMPMETEKHEKPSAQQPVQDIPTASHPGEDVEGAILQNAVPLTEGQSVLPNQHILKADAEMLNEDENVELELREWQAADFPDERAERIWRLYESLTHDLAYALCEQLRLILEPTLATRLKGDYRTGKRLNMKKIISYIASDYTKDKIWLRRTKPSQREYQVLIAIDDSRSMAESHSIHLAYETLALISKSLSRLEAGDVAIAKFGETIDMLHEFDEGPFTDQAGTKVINAFTFKQKATNVLSLVDTSLKVLERARERRAMSSASAADLWQLEIIISDGMCQDHDRLRTVLRRAEEQRIMVVFIILDSLHTNTVPSTGTAKRDPQQGSILSMDKAEFKNVDGRMELQLQKYLDSFPFEYYVVLRDVEALPEVLAGTLKQFFERVSEE